MLLAAALGFFPAAAGAYEFDQALGQELSAEFKKVITAAPVGAELYARLESTSPAGEMPEPPGVLLRRDDSAWLAHYDAAANAVYFNSKFVARFFGVPKMKPAKLVEKLHKYPASRAGFVKDADVLYLHELVHALQGRLYPNYRLERPGGNPVEFEYEAYLIEDLYFHEKMKKDPARLKALIAGSYYDLYTASAMATYLMLSLDMEDYREKIRKKYEGELAGYSSFASNVAAQKNSVEESRIMAYAAGKLKDYADDTAALGQLEAEKAVYAAFLKDFYETRWPKFSAEALTLIGGAALEARNYPLALECLAVADENAEKRRIPPGDLKTLKEKGAVAVLEAAAFIKDRRKKMPLEALSQHLKALEQACKRTGRPFPDEFAALRAGTYPKALKYYSGRAASEKDPEKKEYYEQNVGYFSQALEAVRE